MSGLSKEACIINVIYFGFFILFCAPWILSSNTPYQKLIIAFVWIPALVHVCCFSSRYKSLSRSGASLYFLAATWFLFVVVMHFRGVGDLRELKIPFYIGLTLLGFFAIAEADIDKVKRLLLFSAIVGGFGAWASWIFFYLVEGKALLSRHPAIGLWNVVIPAAQAIGALMLLAVCLGLRETVRPLLRVSLIISLAGYCVFLISNQTRGVWIALLSAFVVAVLLLRNRRVYFLLGAGVAMLVFVYFLNENVFLARGGSYRSELWKGGLMHAFDNLLIGVGFEEVRISIGSAGVVSYHPHNMFIDIMVRFGLVGLLSWLSLWGWAIARAYRFRSTGLGQAALVLLVYSSVVVLTDGIAQWVKPNPGWFVTWLPLALVFALGSDKEKLLPEIRADQK
ncbi:MAG: O-antigen ligase family protein [Pseudomonas sp.]|uniref:O-antigen ligase family protein n=1 Tax=Pseudomonas sp. TaxID=306 RepID=UPI0027335969|nr:O-antigen ligase family protein [Pseudomonas sp.]MDP3845675.1 O-antigen ligase family protein [Pseudomonas sp.]